MNRYRFALYDTKKRLHEYEADSFSKSNEEKRLAYQVVKENTEILSFGAAVVGLDRALKERPLSQYQNKQGGGSKPLSNMYMPHMIITSQISTSLGTNWLC